MIKGLSDFKRLPRLGKIKLGKKDESKNGAPVQTKYFVVPEEVKAIYGEEPTELDIMFPINDLEAVFPQYRKKYGQTGLLCKGDGNCASCMENGQMIEKECTPDAPECKGCKPIGILNVLLPKVSGFGVYQIWTSSWNSIVNLNNAIGMILAMTGRKISFIPLKLVLQEHSAVVHKDGKQFQKKVYVMSINIDTTMGEFYNQYSLEAKTQRGIEESPEFANLIDVSEKFKMLSESKQQEPFILDDDDEEFVVEVEMITQDEAEELDKLADEKGADKAKMLEFYQVEDFRELTQEQYKNAIEVLNKK
ncbi:MAG: hypothetical protein ACM3UU_02925 [Ignavibacteriales bacterium]